MRYACFATTNRGLESLLCDELTQFSATNLESVNAGVKFYADFEQIMQINLHSRLSSRIMLEVGFATYYNEEDIYNLAHKIKWNTWFNSDRTIKVTTSAINCPLTSLEFLNLKVKDAICDYFVEASSKRPSVDKKNPDMRIYNFLDKDTVTIYLDTSGEALFKRGYRNSKQEAPLKENLAYGLVQLTNWNSDLTLYDPMCGSGTILIESIYAALNIAPGLSRDFAMEKFNNFDKNKWTDLKKLANSQIKQNLKLKVYAGDISKVTLESARHNFAQANVTKYVEIISSDFLHKSKPSDNGILIANLPYGIRIKPEDLDQFYVDLATHLKNNYDGWNCYLLTNDLRLPKIMRLKPSKKTPLYNGSLDCRLFEFKMVKGSNRKS